MPGAGTGQERADRPPARAGAWYVRCKSVHFREKLLNTLRTVQPLFQEEGVVVIGSEVPNLLEHDAASTLVVSQDVDIAIDVHRHAQIRARLDELTGLVQSKDEPSVWLPAREGLLEVNFVGVDATLENPTDAYAFDDDKLPLLVFGGLSFVLPPKWYEIEGMRVPLANPAGLVLEKLLTDRTGAKGDRDLLVVVGLLQTAANSELEDFLRLCARLPKDLCTLVQSNLSILSLMEPHPGMPDPEPVRRQIASLLQRLQRDQNA